ncbi:MAG: type IV pilin N-terminal domain-containing protein [Halobacteriota archaeon]|nr:type IV pilin N-terminal domain-containing protein [Halobacteriota archaeon]
MSLLSKDDGGALQTIGVILLVSITVLLASMIAMFAFGMWESVPQAYMVVATAEQIGDDIVVTYAGGIDQGSVSRVKIIKAGDGIVPTELHTVGDSIEFSGAGNPGKDDHVVVIAEFYDGAEILILDVCV